MRDENSKIHNFIKSLKAKCAKENILESIYKGMMAYEDAVDNMTDEQLYKHCFEDDYDPKYENDYCIQVFKKRGLNQLDFINN